MKNITRVVRLSALLFLICMNTTVYSMGKMGKPVPPANVLSEEKARAIALKEYPGKVKESDLEFEKHVWVYSFEIIGADKKEHEINVNAMTGDILESKIETPFMEAKEKIEDLFEKKNEEKEDAEEAEEKEDRR